VHGALHRLKAPVVFRVTQGQTERCHRSMKSVVRLESYHSPSGPEAAIAAFVEYRGLHLGKTAPMPGTMRRWII
jgi:hypothetical protein